MAQKNKNFKNDKTEEKKMKTQKKNRKLTERRKN